MPTDVHFPAASFPKIAFKVVRTAPYLRILLKHKNDGEKMPKNRYILVK
jgi:hypothetical protein